MTRLVLLTATVVCIAWFQLSQEARAARSWVTLMKCSLVNHPSNDGDSFTVKCSEEEFLLRLYYVDAPEANLIYPERTRQQSEYFGATLDDTLWGGRKAKELVDKLLSTQFVVITRKAIAPGRGAGARYYGFVRIGGTALEKELVSNGLARIKGVIARLPDGTKSRDYLKTLARLESEARRQRRGLWSKAKEKL